MTTSAIVRYVPRHVPHHGAHAGYDRLFEAMALPKAESPWARTLADRVPGGLAWRLWALRPQPSQSAGLRAELEALPFISRGRGRLCHFIYGEDTWFYSPLWKRSGNSCVATFHYPPVRLLHRINPGSVAALDGAIILASNQRAALSNLLPEERLHLCLHSVDTEFFCPDPLAAEATTSPKNLRLICCGKLFRDYDTLLKVHRRIRASGFDVTTEVIGPGDVAKRLLQDEPGVSVRSGLSDNDLRSAYRQASVGVLPLLDATANNALLEMLACGLPVVSTSVGGVPEYTEGSAAQLVPLGADKEMAEEVCALLSDSSLRAAHSTQNRAHAEQKLSFAIQGRRMREVYAQVLEHMESSRK